ncbi:hypothetical protein ABTH81_21875, partial [Acinetobacter baumannii]
LAPSSPLPPAWRIDGARLRAALAGDARHWQLQIVEETGSTNADLVQACRATPWAEGDMPQAGMLRLAYRQTAGRGRQGRPWQG